MKKTPGTFVIFCQKLVLKLFVVGDLPPTSIRQ